MTKKKVNPKVRRVAVRRIRGYYTKLVILERELKRLAGSKAPLKKEKIALVKRHMTEIKREIKELKRFL